MKRYSPFLLILTLFIFLGSGEIFFADIGQDPPIKIVASIFPLKEFAQSVAGNRGTVDLLLPPGAEIHSWQPRPSDLIKLSSSDLFVYIGADLEPWAEDILRSVRNPRLTIVKASKGLSLIRGVKETEPHGHESLSSHDSGAVDPHVWLDFKNDEKIVDSIEKALAEIDPGSKDVFLQNAELYKQKLRALDEKYRKGLDFCDQRTIVLGGHGAFGYLARQYNLTQVSLYGLSPDAEPTPSQLIEVIRFVKQKKIKTVFFEWSVSHDLTTVIARETGARTLLLNPGATLPLRSKESAISFLSIMEKNLENLKDGLHCH